MCCPGTVLSGVEAPLALLPSPVAFPLSPDEPSARLESCYFSSQLHPLAVMKCTGAEEVVVTFLGPPESGCNLGKPGKVSLAAWVVSKAETSLDVLWKSGTKLNITG